MTDGAATRGRFDESMLTGLDDPVRRFFAHAIRDGAPLAPRTRLRMEGRIKVGAWLTFEAEEECDVTSFIWRARAGRGRLKPLHVVDGYANGAGSTQGRLLGRLPLFSAADEDTTRAAAARAGAEGLAFAPAGALSHKGVTWRAETGDVIVAAWEVPPERLAVRLEIGADGSPRRFSLPRWGDAGRGRWRYIPFGVEFEQERRFGDLLLPSRFTAGWWFDTPRYAPFFEANVIDAVPIV